MSRTSSRATKSPAPILAFVNPRHTAPPALLAKVQALLAVRPLAAGILERLVDDLLNSHEVGQC